MNKKIVCVTDSTTKASKFFVLNNRDWPWLRMQKEYAGNRDGTADFEEFIKARGAKEIRLPTLDLPSYPDPDYRD